MANLVDAPVRIDTNSKPVDNRMTYLLGANDPSTFLGVAAGGTQATIATPIGQVANFAAANGTGSSACTWDATTNADEYIVEYYVSTAPTVKYAKIATTNSLTVGTLAAGTWTFRCQARVKDGRGDWTYGAWSATDPATVS